MNRVSFANSRVLAYPVIGCGGGLLLLWAANHVQFLLIWVLAVFLLVLGYLPLYWEWRRDSFDLLNIRNAFVIFFLLQNAVWTIYILSTDRTLLPSFDLHASGDTLALATFYSILALASFHWGYYTRFGQKFSAQLPAIPGQWSWEAVTFLSVGFVIFGSSIFLVLMRISGGVISYMADWGFQQQVGLSGRWYLVWASSTLLSFPLLMLFTAAVIRRNRTCYVLAFLSLIVLAITSLTIGFRAMIVMPILQILIIWHYLRRPVRLRFRGQVITLVFLAVLNMHPRIKSASIPTLGAIPGVISNIVRDTQFWGDSLNLTLSRFQGIEIFTTVIEEIPRMDYSFPWGGDAIVAIVTAPIPRAWWPDKPTPLGLQFAQMFFPAVVSRGMGGIPTTWLGETYLNFHVPGIIIASFLLGVFCRICHRYVLANRDNPTVVLVYSFIFVFVLWLVEAPSQAIVTLLTFLPLVPVLFLLTSFRRRRRLVSAQKLPRGPVPRAAPVSFHAGTSIK